MYYMKHKIKCSIADHSAPRSAEKSRTFLNDYQVGDICTYDIYGSAIPEGRNGHRED